MAEKRSLINNGSDVPIDNSVSPTDDVTGMEEIEMVPYRIGERDEEDWVIIGSEDNEENREGELSRPGLEQVQDLIPRTGPQVRDYLAEFFTYVRNRFEFRQNVFYAPMELQTTMEQMETSRVPVSVWSAFMNASTNLLARLGIQFDKHQFLDLLILVLTIISEFFIHNIILQIVVLILGCLGARQLTEIITTIYQFIENAFKLFWAYVKKKLHCYCQLSTKFFKKYMHP